MTTPPPRGWNSKSSSSSGSVAPSSSKVLSKIPKCQPVGNYKEFQPPKDWANAPEFIPKQFQAIALEGEIAEASSLPKPLSRWIAKNASDSSCPSYASVVGSSSNSAPPNVPLNWIKSQSCNPAYSESDTHQYESTELCPYAVVGECRYGDQCLLIHGNRCDYCMHWCIHPYNAKQREAHKKECIRQHEKDMELSFAVAQSSAKTCGICMEVVVDKTPVGEQRFGILPSCNHCFCLSCIRRWRQARQFENKIIRSCPECRVTSDFVCPSRFWVETKQEKDKLIESYKVALSNKACRYYRTGAGTCPFGNKCFYLHALPNGTKVDVGPPPKKPRKENGNGVVTGDHEVTIWEFLEDWELQWLDIDDFMDMIGDSDESELSEPDFQDVESDSDLEEVIRYIDRFCV